MSKSIKRNSKYSNYDDEVKSYHEDHGQKLKEKRLKSALRSGNKDAIFNVIEEDY
tara:strand:+ start:54 stop:218 length:165 start_codon:yes stop_codon:yes gene_type:complete